MTASIQILLLEDNAKDAELLEAALQTAGIASDIVRVETESDFRKALERSLDLIISDYSLPSFDGKRALKIAQEIRPDVPFIFVSATIGEEAAIEGLLGGATDYVLKHRLARFIPAVRRALKENDERNARRKAEEALLRSEERYRRLFEESRDTIFVASADGKLIDINPAGVRMLGYASKAELLRENIGRDIYWDPTRWNEIRSHLRSQDYVEDAEVELKRRDGTKLLALETTTAASSERGKVKILQGVWRDVTKQREMEAQFLRAQRMENLGSLAGGIAHDLNNVLSPIVMGVQLLRERTADADSVRYLEMLESCVKRGANLLRQILVFARGVKGERREVNPRLLIADVEKMLRQTFPKSISIATDVAADLWAVSGDKTQLEQVVMNLCVNARDAMPDGGTLTVTARNELVDNQRNVVVEVTDSGQGIPPENIDKIFDPFFTTKELGTGTGLGLSTVSAIVKSHGGLITVESAPASGTSFAVYLPALAADSGKAQQTAGKASAFPRGNGELILLVDDEAAVRDLACTILEHYGYRVLVAKHGAEALDLYSRRSADIQAVLTDLDMPTMGGAELIRGLEQINPEVRVISASGLIVGDGVGQSVAGVVRAVLQKPFSPADLLITLHDVLHPER